MTSIESDYMDTEYVSHELSDIYKKVNDVRSNSVESKVNSLKNDVNKLLKIVKYINKKKVNKKEINTRSRHNCITRNDVECIVTEYCENNNENCNDGCELDEQIKKYINHQINKKLDCYIENINKKICDLEKEIGHLKKIIYSCKI